MKAILEIEAKNPQAVMESIAVDETASRVRIFPRVSGNKLVVEIAASDFSGLRAGVTTYLRLVKASLAGLGE